MIAKKIERVVTDKGLCDFYHSVDLPDGSFELGQWDLRETASQYLGNLEFKGKRVIEIGPATGFLSFYMEGEGAQVTCIEPPMQFFWDLVPRADTDQEIFKKKFSHHIERIRNGFWYLHHIRGSKVEMYETSAYNISERLGLFDVGILASVLLHCSSPVRMIESVAKTGVSEIVICEMFVENIDREPICRLFPSKDNNAIETWWQFSPTFFVQYLEVLGFNQTKIIRHRQLNRVSMRYTEMFTIVGSRGWRECPDRC